MAPSKDAFDWELTRDGRESGQETKFHTGKLEGYVTIGAWEKKP